jgi:hypothetical protein
MYLAKFSGNSRISSSRGFQRSSFVASTLERSAVAPFGPLRSRRPTFRGLGPQRSMDIPASRDRRFGLHRAHPNVRGDRKGPTRVPQAPRTSQQSANGGRGLSERRALSIRAASRLLVVPRVRERWQLHAKIKPRRRPSSPTTAAATTTKHSAASPSPPPW